MTLLVAATEMELCGHAGLVCGVGPVEAAAATARALALEAPTAVLHVGVAGGVGLEPGTLVVGSESSYVDLSAAIPVVAHVVPDRALFESVLAAGVGAVSAPIFTSAAVGETRVPGTEGARHRVAAEGRAQVPGTAGAWHRAEAMEGRARVPGTAGAWHRVEAMEGFGVLRACALAGVPAVEVRAISNELGEEDRSRWEIPRALEALGAALPRLLAALPQ